MTSMEKKDDAMALPASRRSSASSTAASDVEAQHGTDQNEVPPDSVKANAPVTAAPQQSVPGKAEVQMSEGRKWFLLFIFSVAMYLDVAGRSGVFIFTDQISGDLAIRYETSTWVLNAYNVTFAAFLPFWGRVSDLFSAKPVFTYGFLFLGLSNLITSFMPNEYAFFVFRAIAGIFAAATIPSAFRLIIAVFDPSQVHTAITLFSLTGAMANATGLIIGGIFGIISAGGQDAGWRWFFRFITIVSVPFSILAGGLVPKTQGARAGAASKWRQFDLIGCAILLISNVLLILGLTLGASYGWKTAKFLVPFLLAWPLYVFFFWWENRLPPGFALVPPSFWKSPNILLLMFVGLEVLSYWSVVQLPLVERWENVFGESLIKSAARGLPNGIAACCMALVLPRYLPRMNQKWLMIISLLISGSAFLLFIYSEGAIYNGEYWRWDFPALIIGSAANACLFSSTNVTVVKSVPPQMSGMAGAMIQIAYQVGAVISLSVQAGLLTTHPGSISNWANVQASFWFQFGWIMFNMILVAIFFRRPSASAAAVKGASGGAGQKGQDATK